MVSASQLSVTAIMVPAGVNAAEIIDIAERIETALSRRG